MPKSITILPKNVNKTYFTADFLAFSAHKMLGPTGIGVLYGRYELLDKLKQLDEGEVVDVLDFDNAVNPKDLDPVVLLYQAGYLTIKKTVGRQGFRLGIPNVELQSYLYQEFYYSITYHRSYN